MDYYYGNIKKILCYNLYKGVNSLGVFFGTDGVRGIANIELTNEMAYKLGRFGANVITKGKKDAKIIVGKDTRISGDMLESSIIAGILSAGCDVVKVGVIPTPAIPRLIKHFTASAGVMISASHNPFEYNGIKFFCEDGYKLPDSVENEIEAYIIENRDIESVPVGNELGKVLFADNGIEVYGDFVKSTVDVTFEQFKIAMDCANGSSFNVAKKVIGELSGAVLAINDNPNGYNINDNCGSTHMDGIMKYTVENGCDIGLAFDGDADRLLVSDEKGKLVDGDKIMAICAKFMSDKKMLKNNTVVTTVMSNIGFDIALKRNNISSSKTKVGDRYVLEEMKRGGFSLGGEQSGHIIFLDYNTTGDALLTAVQLLAVMKKTGKKISELAEVMDVYPQVLLNARVPNHLKNQYEKNDIISQNIEKVQKNLDGEGRVLVRPSGTEPLVRVMIEGKDQEQLNLYAKELVRVIEENLN